MKEFPPEDVVDEIYPDDGRVDNSNEDYDYKGDWGNHGEADWVADNVDIVYDII